MLRYSVIAIGVLLLLLIGWVVFVALKTPTCQVPDTRNWATGDIFYSVGDSWESVAVRAITGARSLALPDSTPSHCGMVLQETDGIWLVHESTEKRKIVKERAEDYQSINGSYCLYARTPDLHIDTIELRNAITYWLQQEKPFDFDFDHNDTTAFYCTEFVITLLERSAIGSGANQDKTSYFSILRKIQYIYPKDLLELSRP